MAKILVIDDEPAIRRILREILEHEQYNVDDAASAIDALPLVKDNEYDAILCDIKMPQMDGIEFLEEAKKISDAPIIMISGHGTIDTAVEAIKKGAFDYIAKPPELNRLLITLRNALDKSKLMTETKVLKKAVNRQYQMIGSSRPMMEIHDMIDDIERDLQKELMQRLNLYRAKQRK